MATVRTALLLRLVFAAFAAGFFAALLAAFFAAFFTVFLGFALFGGAFFAFAFFLTAALLALRFFAAAFFTERAGFADFLLLDFVFFAMGGTFNRYGRNYVGEMDRLRI